MCIRSVVSLLKAYLPDSTKEDGFRVFVCLFYCDYLNSLTIMKWKV